MKRIAILLALVAAAGAAAQPGAKFPNGVFRTTITDADLKAGHAPDVTENHGAYTMTLTPGHWRWTQTAPNPLAVPAASGVYTVSGNRIRFTIRTPVDLAGYTTSGTWSYDGRALRFHGMRNDPDAHVVFTAHPWRRLG